MAMFGFFVEKINIFSFVHLILTIIEGFWDSCFMERASFDGNVLVVSDYFSSEKSFLLIEFV